GLAPVAGGIGWVAGRGTVTGAVGRRVAIAGRRWARVTVASHAVWPDCRVAQAAYRAETTVGRVASGLPVVGTQASVRIAPQARRDGRGTVERRGVGGRSRGARAAGRVGARVRACRGARTRVAAGRHDRAVPAQHGRATRAAVDVAGYREDHAGIGIGRDPSVDVGAGAVGGNARAGV